MRGKIDIDKMAIYTEAFIHQIKEKLDIVDLISGYISVSRKGRDYWACCPFHSEKTPSFQIRQDYQYYKCYGCGKSGDIITFVMDYENVTFSEAVEILAGKAGLELPQNNEDAEYIKKKEILNKIYEINRHTAYFYHKNLFSEQGKTGLEYFQSRNLDSQMITVFGLGYSCDYNSLPEYLSKKGYDIKSMKEAGVIGINDFGKPFDFFGERIIIPIINAAGKVIGFTARLLDKKPDFAKYKNTSNTMAFDKRKNLFGINLLKKQHLQGIRKVILVEGHMDVIGLYQYGITNVVASMGTSLTIEQCRELKRYADIVYVSFDGDSAGQNATLRSLDMLKKEGLEVRVVMLSGGLDPDDYVRQYGKESYEKLLNEAVPLIDFKLLSVKKKYNLTSYDDRAKYAKEAISILSGLSDLEKSVYVDEVARLSSINKDVLLGQIGEYIENNNRNDKRHSVKEPKSTTKDNNVNVAAQFVLSAILHLENFVDFSEITGDFFTANNHKKLYEYILRCIDKKTPPKPSDVYEVLENDDECIEIIDAVERYCDFQNKSKFYIQSLTTLKREERRSKLLELNELLKTASTEAEINDIKEKIKKYQNKKQL